MRSDSFRFLGKRRLVRFYSWLLHLFFNTSPPNRAVNRIKILFDILKQFFWKEVVSNHIFCRLKKLIIFIKASWLFLLTVPQKEHLVTQRAIFFVAADNLNQIKDFFMHQRFSAWRHSAVSYLRVAMWKHPTASARVQNRLCAGQKRGCRALFTAAVWKTVVFYFIMPQALGVSSPRERASGVGRRVATSTAVNAANIERAAPLLRPSVGRSACSPTERAHFSSGVDKDLNMRPASHYSVRSDNYIDAARCAGIWNLHFGQKAKAASREIKLL